MELYWIDGTPRSTGNAFDWNTGEPSIFYKDVFFSRSTINQLTATRTISKARAKGEDKTTFYGLSVKADSLVFDFKAASKFNIHIPSREEADRTKSIRNSK